MPPSGPVVLAAAAVVSLLLAACGAAGGTDRDSQRSAATPPLQSPTGAGPTGDATLTGSLGGDAGLEGGCAWLDTADGRWEVQYPEGYRVEFGPLRLLAPDGRQIAAEGDAVTVTGAAARDAMSICQVGPIWRATSVAAG